MSFHSREDATALSLKHPGEFFPCALPDGLLSERAYIITVDAGFLSDGKTVESVEDILAFGMLGGCSFYKVRHGSGYRLINAAGVIDIAGPVAPATSNP